MNTTYNFLDLTAKAAMKIPTPPMMGALSRRIQGPSKERWLRLNGPANMAANPQHENAIVSR
jgi:hypothetical protein